MEPTNLEKWRFYCKDFPTTDLYVDFAWYWAISAALQRRVWIGSQSQGIFPNMYVFFIAEPAVGKSIALDPIDRLLRSIPDTKRSLELNAERPTLFRVGANSTSYERFIHFCANSVQFVRVNNDYMYTYTSPCLILDELASIFKEHAGDMSTFLLEAWNCKAHYVRDTHKHDEQPLKNICLNLIGGCQPDKLAEIKKKVDILGSGFSRRALWIHGDKNRLSTLYITHAPEQIAAYNSLAPHLVALSKLYGEVKLSPGAAAVLNDWFKPEDPAFRINKSTFLDFYYPSKNLHVFKLSMAVHFSESTSMEIGAESVTKALALLAAVEKDMDLAFAGNSTSRERCIKGILGCLEHGPQFEGALYRSFIRDIKFTDFTQILSDLALANKVTLTDSNTRLWKKGPL